MKTAKMENIKRNWYDYEWTFREKNISVVPLKNIWWTTMTERVSKEEEEVLPMIEKIVIWVELACDFQLFIWLWSPIRSDLLPPPPPAS